MSDLQSIPRVMARDSTTVRAGSAASARSRWRPRSGCGRVRSQQPEGEQATDDDHEEDDRPLVVCSCHLSQTVSILAGCRSAGRFLAAYESVCCSGTTDSRRADGTTGRSVRLDCGTADASLCGWGRSSRTPCATPPRGHKRGVRWPLFTNSSCPANAPMAS